MVAFPSATVALRQGAQGRSCVFDALWTSLEDICLVAFGNFKSNNGAGIIEVAVAHGLRCSFAENGRCFENFGAACESRKER